MATFIHRLALCESDAIGDGTRIWAFAHVMQGAIVGCDCNIGDHAFVESGATVGDRVTIKNGVLIWDGVTIADEAFIGPGVIFTNDRHPRSPRMPAAADRYAERSNWLSETSVGRGASLGAGSVILPGLSIGDYAMVGAGAVVTRDVSPHSIVVGHPARAIGWACKCGQHSPVAGPCESCRKAEGARGEGRGTSVAGLRETDSSHTAAAQPSKSTAPHVFVLAPRP
jgi:acetyltransferase-like isoleucine patch superfamily enzyme